MELNRILSEHDIATYHRGQQPHPFVYANMHKRRSGTE